MTRLCDGMSEFEFLSAACPFCASILAEMSAPMMPMMMPGPGFPMGKPCLVYITWTLG
jgi:hypothetical protein